MSHFDYVASKRIALTDWPFKALLMSTMRQADLVNQRKLRKAFPDVWDELTARYDAPGGYLLTDPDIPAHVRTQLLES